MAPAGAQRQRARWLGMTDFEVCASFLTLHQISHLCHCEERSDAAIRISKPPSGREVAFAEFTEQKTEGDGEKAVSSSGLRRSSFFIKNFVFDEVLFSTFPRQKKLTALHFPPSGKSSASFLPSSSQIETPVSI